MDGCAKTTESKSRNALAWMFSCNVRPFGNGSVLNTTKFFQSLSSGALDELCSISCSDSSDRYLVEGGPSHHLGQEPSFGMAQSVQSTKRS